MTTNFVKYQEEHARLTVVLGQHVKEEGKCDFKSYYYCCYFVE